MTTLSGRRTVKFAYLILGFLCILLGLVGVVLPVLPTVPFLLAASFCLAKGSQRFHDWFLSTVLYTKYLEKFADPRQMTLKAKIKMLAFTTLVLLVPFVYVEVLYSRIAIIAALVFKYYYFMVKLKI